MGLTYAHRMFRLCTADARAAQVSIAVALCAVAALTPALADTGKLLLTGGVGSIDGAAGGGLSPWALVGTNATEGQWGVSAHLSTVQSRDYGLNIAALTLAWDDRIELSLARQDFDTRATGTALGLPGLHLRQDIVGAKWRVAGDAVLDSDRWMPQIAFGVEAKRLDAGALGATLTALGARREGVDVYLSATKLLLPQAVLVNATLRATRANQNGLLGFGSTGHSQHRLLPEISVAWLLCRQLAVGAEWRAKPDNLNPSALGAGLKEDDWRDIFVAWAPNKQWSVTAAWVDLGRIVPAVQPHAQRAAYLSLQWTH